MRRSLAVFVLLAASGCLPSRDNPVDPANAPDVQVRFLDVTREDGTCPPDPVEPSTIEPVSALSRGRCVMIDASQTVDAGGNPITAADAFDYLIEDTPPFEAPDAGPRLLLSDDDRHGLTPNAVLTVRVVATDSHGYRGEGAASIVFLNAAPTVRALPPRLLRLGGHPWAPGAPIDVTFSAAAADPDGELVRTCWTFPGEAELCGDRGDTAPITRPIDVSSKRRIVALVRTFDDEAYSPFAAEEISVDLPALWAANRYSDPIFRFDGGATYVWIDDTGFPSATGAAAAGDSWVIGYRTFDFGFTDEITGCAPPGPCPAGTPLGPSFGSQGMAIATNTAGTLAWVVSNADAYAFDVTDIGGGNLGFTAAGNTPVATGLPSYDDLLSAIDGSSAMWIATVRESFGAVGHVERIGLDGSIAIAATNDSLAITALESRPGTNEIWAAAETADGIGSPVPAGIRVWSGSAPTDAPLIFDTPFGVSGLTFVDRDLVWVGLPGEGLALLDVPVLLATGEVGDAILALASFDARPSNLQTDPETGAVRAEGRDPDTGVRAFFSADRFGGLSIVSSLFLERSVAIAADGRSVRASGNVHLTFGTGADELVERFYANRQNNASLGYDPATGGLWVSVVEPNGMELRAIDGRVISLFTTAIVDGVEKPFPDFRPSAWSPDGTWVIGGGANEELVRVSLNGTSAPVVTVLDETDYTSTLVQAMAIAGPAASGDRVWGIYPNGGSTAGYFDAGGPVDMDTDFVAVFTTGGFVVYPQMEVAQGSGDACLGYYSNGTAGAELWRFHADGSANRHLASIPDGGLPVGVFALAGTSESDACWFWLIYQDDPSGHFRVVGYLPDGTLLADEEFVGQGTALDGVVLSDSKIWLLVRVDPPPVATHARLFRLDVVPGSPGLATGAQLTPLDSALPANDSALVMP